MHASVDWIYSTLKRATEQQASVLMPSAHHRVFPSNRPLQQVFELPGWMIDCRLSKDACQLHYLAQPAVLPESLPIVTALY